MEIKTFWTIILKGIGLWILLNAIYIIPQFTTTLFVFDNEIVWDNLLITWLISIAVFVLYILVARVFLFKSDWLMHFLKLDKNFTTEKIDINISSENLLKIIIIITGALILVEALPNLVAEIYQFLRQKELIKDYSETSWLFYYFLKSLFGYLIMTNSKFIEKFINKEAKNEL